MIPGFGHDAIGDDFEAIRAQARPEDELAAMLREDVYVPVSSRSSTRG
jgi:hypothetical protein